MAQDCSSAPATPLQLRSPTRLDACTAAHLGTIREALLGALAGGCPLGGQQCGPVPLVRLERRACARQPAVGGGSKPASKPAQHRLLECSPVSCGAVPRLGLSGRGLGVHGGRLLGGCGQGMKKVTGHIGKLGAPQRSGIVPLSRLSHILPPPCQHLPGSSAVGLSAGCSTAARRPCGLGGRRGAGFACYVVARRGRADTQLLSSRTMPPLQQPAPRVLLGQKHRTSAESCVCSPLPPPRSSVTFKMMLPTILNTAMSPACAREATA